MNNALKRSSSTPSGYGGGGKAGDAPLTESLKVGNEYFTMHRGTSDTTSSIPGCGEQACLRQFSQLNKLQTRQLHCNRPTMGGGDARRTWIPPLLPCLAIYQ